MTKSMVPQRASTAARWISLALTIILAIGTAAWLTTAKTRNVAVETATISQKTDIISVTLRIPVFTGLGDGTAQEQLNSSIRQNALDFAAKIEELAREAKEEEWFRPYEVVVDYEVRYLSDEVVSLLISYYQYTGGAHGLTPVEGLTVDARTGRKLALQDLFQPGTDYRAVISTEIARQFDARRGDFFPDARDTALDFDENDFYVEGGDIVIFFQQYDIAPYAAGHPEFRIPVAFFGDSVTSYLRH